MEIKKVFEFARGDNYGFNFYFDKELTPGTYILKMPRVTPNKRGVNDIGFAYDEGVTLFGTLARDYQGENVLWQKINPFDEINKTVSYIRIVVADTVESARVNVRAILN